MRNRFFTLGIAMAAWVGVAASPYGHIGAAEPTPPLEIRSAMAKRDKAADAAAQVYWKAVIQANKQFVADLEAQLKVAMRGNDANKVVLIKEAIDQAKEELAKAEAKARTGGKPTGRAIVEVLGNRPWQPFGDVHKGDVLVFKAEGRWSADVNQPNYTVGPEGGIKGGKIGQLQGRVGQTGAVFEIGASARYVVPADGVLYMQMNDPGHENNGGQLTVMIEKE